MAGSRGAKERTDLGPHPWWGRIEEECEGSTPMSGDLESLKVLQLGLGLACHARALEAGETLVRLLAQQLEQAKIAEARGTPPGQVLDRAVPAEGCSRLTPGTGTMRGHRLLLACRRKGPGGVPWSAPAVFGSGARAC